MQLRWIKAKGNIQLRNYSKKDVIWTQIHKVARLSACGVVQHNLKIDCMSESEIIISYDLNMKGDLGCTDMVEHCVCTTGNTPVKQRDRRIPHH